ncbi:MAG: GYF domain-containing protein [Planctomycetota bacterium]
MTAWFVQQNDETELGPLKPADLLELVRSGKVLAETMLKKDDSAWFPASDVGGLFEAARRPTIEYYCIDCGAQVKQPPTHCPHCIKDIQKARTHIVEHSVGSEPTAKSSEPKGPSDSAKRWLNRRLGKTNRN